MSLGEAPVPVKRRIGLRRGRALHAAKISEKQLTIAIRRFVISVVMLRFEITVLRQTSVVCDLTTILDRFSCVAKRS